MNARSLILRCAILITAALTTGCTADSGAPLTVSGVRLLAPLPGGQATVGYLSLHNQSTVALTIDHISSPNFGKVQMHETIINDGVARMQALPSVTIEPGLSVQFVAGGKHLMLLEPTTATATGTNVALEIHYDAGGLLIVSAILQTRMPAE